MQARRLDMVTCHWRELSQQQCQGMAICAPSRGCLAACGPASQVLGYDDMGAGINRTIWKCGPAPTPADITAAAAQVRCKLWTAAGWNYLHVWCLCVVWCCQIERHE